jgi:hypothetical protein
MSSAPPQAGSAPPRSFAALRHPGFRPYFVTTALAMMGDNIEHVITYWIMFEKFRSPALGGFAGAIPLAAFPAVLGVLRLACGPLRLSPDRAVLAVAVHGRVPGMGRADLHRYPGDVARGGASRHSRHGGECCGGPPPRC